MKLRIIQFENGKYQVQYQYILFGKWFFCTTHRSDYELNYNEEDWNKNVFSDLSLAESKLNRFILNHQKEQGYKKFKVIKVVKL